MEHVDVESTLIHSVRYDEAHRMLDISFNDDGTYRYYEVPPEVVEELLDAESKGRYFTKYRLSALPLATWTASECEALVA